MVTRKAKANEPKTPATLSHNEPDMVPAYINNVRIKTTADNVFIDFGFVDPFATDSNLSTVLQRVVMNQSTFDIFAKHVANQKTEIGKNTTDMPIVIMSRCPPKAEM